VASLSASHIIKNEFPDLPVLAGNDNDLTRLTLRRKNERAPFFACAKMPLSETIL